MTSTVKNVMTVYLAGPIAGLTFDGASDWRVHVSSELMEHGIKCLSPLRGMEYLRAAGTLGGGHGVHGLLSDDRAIMTRDFWDATNCDVMMVNVLGATKPSLGTCFEIAWAYQARIPVVIAMEKTGNPHDYLMVREAIGYRMENLVDAMTAVKMFADNGAQ